MPINNPPIRDLAGDDAEWTSAWAIWFVQVFSAIFGWRKTYTATLSKTWGAISNHSEDSQTVTVTGARSGDAVLVTPATKTTGIVDNIGVVTASNVVTVYAQNTTGGSVTPGAKTYRVIVFQQ